MKLVSIYAAASDSSRLLGRLQEMSVIDIDTVAEDEQTAALPEGYNRQDASAKAAIYDRNVKTAEDALHILNARFPEKKGLLASLSAPRTVTRSEFELSRAHVEQALEWSNTIVEKEHRIAEQRAEALRLRTTADQMRPWEPLDVPLSFNGTSKTTAFIGTIEGVWTEETLLAAFVEHDPALLVHAEIVATGRDVTYIFALCPKSQKTAAEAVLRELSFARPMQITSRLPADKLASKKEREQRCEQDADACIAAIGELAERRRDIADYCRVRADRLRAMSEIGRTPHTVLIKGYVAERDVAYLQKRLDKDFTVVLEVEDADEELAPVRLQNNKLFEPAETITEMYALPSRTDIDPSPLTGFFYYLFFGMMLSDAGYGLLLVFGTLFALKKLNPKPSMRKNLKLFFYCGISTTAWGLLFGSFFGDSISVIAQNFFGKTITMPALLDPLNGDAVTLLILSFVLGLVQIIAGLVAKACTCIKNGDIAGAVFDAGLWITTLLGLGILALGMFTLPVLTTVGGVIAIASVVGLILTQGRDKKNPIMRLFSGIASLYDITGYVSDLLSFSRLMALGLTTAAMAKVFNLLGTLAGGGIIGVLLMLVMFPLGHAITFALNALGAYVHTLRLQYVELFSKFYEGGGRTFKPLSFNSHYVGLHEDNMKEEL